MCLYQALSTHHERDNVLHKLLIFIIILIAMSSCSLLSPALMMSLTALIVRLVYDESWDWFVALMFGAVVCATDSLAVDEIVRVSGKSIRLP